VRFAYKISRYGFYRADNDLNGAGLIGAEKWTPLKLSKYVLPAFMDTSTNPTDFNDLANLE
jgi:hypothetical protein